jgi:hypothetical protein
MNLRTACRPFALLPILCLAVASASAAGAAPASKVEFNRDVRPILSDTCFKCHGFDKGARKADLRLDVRDEALAPRHGDNPMIPIVPGDPGRSAIWKRIITTDKDDLMPPPDSHLVLSDAQKDTIKRWIEQGAEYQPHWAFLPVKQPPVPTPKKAGWVRNPIDAFVLAKLESEKLSPSPEADRATLIRRVSFDLTGLPPKRAEVDAFVNDSSPDAYEKVVDRLLASTAYGERMAVDWLDESRYADSHGFNNDTYRSMWRWRDWVINAFNANKHYDTFITEQLAGDLLPNATLDQKIASGYNRNNVANSEGGIIQEEYRVEYVVDRTTTAGTMFMGLTVQCARCHDHKYDPLTQKEFYQLFAFFNQLNEPGQIPTDRDPDPVIKAPTTAQQAELASLTTEIASLDKAKQARVKLAAETQPKWEPSLQAELDKLPKAPVDGQIAFLNLEHTKFDGTNSISLGTGVGDFERTDKFSYGAWVKPEESAKDALTIVARMDDANASRGHDLILTGGKPEAHVINAWPGNALRVIAKEPLKPGAWHHVFVTYDGSSKAAGLKLYVDGQPVAVDATHDTLSATTKSKVSLNIGKRSTSLPYKGTIGDVRIYDRALSPAEVQAVAADGTLAKILKTPADQRTPEQQAVLRNHYLSTADAEYQQLSKKLDAARQHEAELNAAVPTVMVMADNMSPPRKTFLLYRGAYDAPRDEVHPGTPAFLPPMPEGAPKNRLGFAQWLTMPNHPLTSRVAVNRFWYQYFGVGLVKTLQDWGVQGELPSDPELLDWLAAHFMQSGWDIKALQRLIVTSATYRQAATYSPEMLERDPENRLLARGPRMRMSAEMIRDNALAVAGLLVDKVGGPSVMPYQPAGLWEDVVVGANYPGTKYTQAHGPDLYRRSLYTYWKRTAPPPALNIFDAPEREFCTISRPQTNTPLQALVLMNDPTYTEASRKIGERMMKEGGATADERIAWAFKLVTARSGNADELKVLRETFDRRLASFQKNPDGAKKLLAAGESPRDEKLDASELAAYTTVASMILNLDETITK